MADVTVEGHWLLSAGPADNPVLRLWSGAGELDYDGQTWQGVSSDTGEASLVSISPAEVREGVPDRRATISVVAEDPTLRASLLQDHGPLPVRILWVSRSSPLDMWSVVGRVVGRMSGTEIDAENIWTAEIETYGGTIDRGIPLYWSDESQQVRFPGDRSFAQLRDIVEGIEQAGFPP